MQSGDEDLRERREGLDGVGEDVEWDVGADSQRRLLQPFARLGTQRVRAGQSLAVTEQREKAVLSAYARVYVAVFATPDTGTIALQRPAEAPTAAACGSV